MGINAKVNIKTQSVKKKPTVINDYKTWRSKLQKLTQEPVQEQPVVDIETPLVEEPKVEMPKVEDTKSIRQPSSKWLSIKDSDYVKQLTK